MDEDLFISSLSKDEMDSLLESLEEIYDENEREDSNNDRKQ